MSTNWSSKLIYLKFKPSVHPYISKETLRSDHCKLGFSFRFLASPFPPFLKMDPKKGYF